MRDQGGESGEGVGVKRGGVGGYCTRKGRGNERVRWEIRSVEGKEEMEKDEKTWEMKNEGRESKRRREEEE